MTAGEEEPLDPVLQAIAPESRLAGLTAIQHRLADLLFVELLFEKGPREVAMINDEYAWRKAILTRQEEAAQDARADVRADRGGEGAADDAVASDAGAGAGMCLH